LASIDESFAEWVKGKGGCESVVKAVEKFEAEMAKAVEKPRTIGKQKFLFRTAEEAIRNLARHGQAKDVYAIDRDAMPEMFDKLRPAFYNTFRMLVVNLIDDELVFHGFYDHQVNFGQVLKNGQKVIKPLNLDGTSASKWPDWILAKPPAATG